MHHHLHAAVAASRSADLDLRAAARLNVELASDATPPRVSARRTAIRSAVAALLRETRPIDVKTSGPDLR